jgi:hypothetical protein
MHLRGAAAKRQAPKSKPRLAVKPNGLDDFKTLKQACPSEYQWAQGAFKDSMIH